MKRFPHLVFIVGFLFVVVSSGCISIMYHTREFLGYTEPRCYPGLMYYFRGVQDGFSASYRQEIVQNFPLGLFAPVFMAMDCCCDTMFLPFDSIFLACSSGHSVEFVQDGKFCLRSSRQMLLKDAKERRIVLECIVENGSIIIRGQKKRKSSLDYYFPQDYEIVLGSGLVYYNEKGNNRFVAGGRARLEFEPPVFDFWNNDNRWTIMAISMDGTTSDAVLVSDIKWSATGDFRILQ